MTDAEARDFVASQNWAFAKTMPQIPHFWSLLKDARDAAEFHRFVRHIDTAGQPMRWRRTPVRRYLDLDGWRYWTMDRDLKDVTLINRQVLSISECVPA